MNRLVTLGLATMITGCGLAPPPTAAVDADIARVVDDVELGAGLDLWDASLRFTELEQGRVRGTIGSLTVDAAPDIANVYDDGHFAQLAVYALAPTGGRVMLRLDIDAGIERTTLVPGIGSRFRPSSRVSALACQGGDSGDASAPFTDTTYDAVPCEVAIDAEQDVDDPQALRVRVAATLPGNGGACINGDATETCADGMAVLAGSGCSEVELHDLDGDGDGDLDNTPWDAEATFVLRRE